MYRSKREREWRNRKIRRSEGGWVGRLELRVDGASGRLLQGDASGHLQAPPEAPVTLRLPMPIPTNLLIF
jgi:hypothetical protein